MKRLSIGLGVAIGFLAASPAFSADSKPVTIALFVAIQANPVEQAIINNFMKVTDADGAVKVVVFDSNNSVQKELANCKDAIATGKFDAFALKAVAGPPLMACARDAIAAGIPVVAFGNALGPSPDTAERQIPELAGSVVHLARSNGIAIADLANEACESRKADPCAVIYTYGPLAFDWASISRKFFEETVAAKYPAIKIVASGTNDFNPDTARTLVKTLVQTHPEVDVVANDVDFAAGGAIAALKDMGRAPGKDVLVTGAALSNQGKGLMDAGEMFGSTCLLPATEAKTAAQYSILAARREKIDQPDIEVCRMLAPTGTAPITAANVQQFTPEW
ncbi:MAG: sugar ABC transporter substrate-binding protein [Bauldia sp.]